MITQTINLNLIPGQVLPRVNVSQYDSGTRTLRMVLYNGDVNFEIPNGAGAVLQGTKPDRTGFQYQVEVTAGSSIVLADITEQMTAVKGEVVTELVITDTEDRIATVNFIIAVEPAALADDTIISETMLPLIEEAAEIGQQIQGIIAEIDEDADRSEGYAVGTKDGEPVPSTDPTYHNNSKYYAEQAEASATSVGDLAEQAEAWAVGEKDGEPVPSSDPTYHNNAKYYANSASGSASTAVASDIAAAQSKEDAEAWAVGERGSIPVTSGDATYHNNAKYYAENAGTSASNAASSETNAGISETNAATSKENAEAWAVGQRNGVDVPPTDPNYHNNAKYYAESIGVPGISTLTDVTLASLTDGQLLRYNATSQKWENVSPDTAPTQNSTVPLSSGGAYTALDNKENKYTELTQTLAAGATQVTFTNAAITATADVWIKTNKPGLNWTNATDTEGSCTITYPAQSSPVNVKLIIRG